MKKLIVSIIFIILTGIIFASCEKSDCEKDCEKTLERIKQEDPEDSYKEKLNQCIQACKEYKSKN